MGRVPTPRNFNDGTVEIQASGVNESEYQPVAEKTKA